MTQGSRTGRPGPHREDADRNCPQAGAPWVRRRTPVPEQDGGCHGAPRGPPAVQASPNKSTERRDHHVPGHPAAGAGPDPHRAAARTGHPRPVRAAHTVRGVRRTGAGRPPAGRQPLLRGSRPGRRPRLRSVRPRPPRRTPARRGLRRGGRGGPGRLADRGRAPAADRGRAWPTCTCWRRSCTAGTSPPPQVRTAPATPTPSRPCCTPGTATTRTPPVPGPACSARPGASRRTPPPPIGSPPTSAAPSDRGTAREPGDRASPGGVNRPRAYPWHP